MIRFYRCVARSLHTFFARIDQAILVAFSVGLFVFNWLFYAIVKTSNEALAENVFWVLFPACCFSLYIGLSRPVKHRYLQRLAVSMGICFTFNNLLDDWGYRLTPATWHSYFFDPHKLQVNEIVIATITVILIVRAGRTRKKARNI